MKILADATLANLYQFFPKPFNLTLYQQGTDLLKLIDGQDILLCRSTLRVDEQLLKGSSLRYVATASSGIDHIDRAYLQANSIALLDAKGSNAIAVTDYVIATLAFLQTYHAFNGQKAGIIGLGEVGSRLRKCLIAAKMDVLCYDPPKSKLEKDFISSPLAALADCDLLCVHANLHEEPPYPSKDLINETLLKQLKPSCVIINASRGGIVNEEDLLKQAAKTIHYCTDVYSKEPFINPAIVDRALICTPHIAGHSIEAKQRALSLLSQKLHACYQLPPPATPLTRSTGQANLLHQQGWQDPILSLYNPMHETTILKNNQHNLTETFLKLRKAHQRRHDFCTYPQFAEEYL